MPDNAIITNDAAPTTAIVSKDAVKQAPIMFGPQWIGSPTPVKIKWIFRIVLYLNAALNIVILTIPQIPAETKVLILSISNIGTTLVHSFSKLFGIDISDIIPPEVATTPKN